MIIIKVTKAPEYTRQQFQATLSEWDLGMPISYGKTIPEVIEDFLDSYEAKFNVRPQYKWL